MVDPQALLITGLTRDGLFLIENGKVTRPVKNLRWSETRSWPSTTSTRRRRRAGGWTRARSRWSARRPDSGVHVHELVDATYTLETAEGTEGTVLTQSNEVTETNREERIFVPLSISVNSSVLIPDWISASPCFFVARVKSVPPSPRLPAIVVVIVLSRDVAVADQQPAAGDGSARSSSTPASRTPRRSGTTSSTASSGSI